MFIVLQYKPQDLGGGKLPIANATSTTGVMDTCSGQDTIRSRTTGPKTLAD